MDVLVFCQALQCWLAILHMTTCMTIILSHIIDLAVMGLAVT